MRSLPVSGGRGSLQGRICRIRTGCCSSNGRLNMADYTAHVDTFAREHLPPRAQWPEFLFERRELQYAARLNCGRVLLDDALEEGHGSRFVVYSDHAAWTWVELRDKTDRIANVLVREL